MLGYVQKSPAFLLDEVGYDIIAWYTGLRRVRFDLKLMPREIMILAVLLINHGNAIGVEQIKDYTSGEETYNLIYALRAKGIVDHTVKTNKTAKQYFLTKKGMDIMRQITDIFYEEKLKLA